MSERVRNFHEYIGQLEDENQELLNENRVFQQQNNLYLKAFVAIENLYHELDCNEDKVDGIMMVVRQARKRLGEESQ